MPTYRISEQLEFEGFDGHNVVAAFDGGATTSDAGALVLRQVDAAIGLAGRVAACEGNVTTYDTKPVHSWRDDPSFKRKDRDDGRGMAGDKASDARRRPAEGQRRVAAKREAVRPSLCPGLRPSRFASRRPWP